MIGVASQNDVLNGVHINFAVLNDIGIEVIATVRAGVHGGKELKEVFEVTDDVWGMAGSSGDFGQGMEETPDSRADVVGKAEAHLGGLNIVTANTNINKGDILTEVARFPAKFKALSPLLHAIEIMTGESPRLLEHQLFLGATPAKMFSNIKGIGAKFGQGFLIPSIECRFIRV